MTSVSVQALPALPPLLGLAPGAWLLGVLLVAGLALVAAVVLAQLARLRALERLAAAEEGRLAKLEQALARLADSHASLDLRRLEHVLIDLRDGQRRADTRLQAVLEAAVAGAPEGGAAQPAGANGAPPPASAGRPLAERVVSRLLAMDFERIEILDPPELIAVVAREGGELIVEARRHGAVHKGKVVVEGGGIADVHLRPSYEIFP